jgi:serine/threonine-protein kinase
MLLDEDALHATLERFAPLADTIQQNPRATIEPRTSTADENEKRAMEVLTRVSMSGAGALELERTLGEGGMGIVRLATQVALGRKVAVKSLKDEARTQRMTLKLLREAWITGALEHPNVMPVYDLGVDAQGGPRLVLKRIEGVEWAALIADEKAVAERFGGRSLLDWNLSIFQQVAQAVHFAHSRGIVHRDLKPENVMIGSFGEVYVLDWGIAVSLRDDGSGRLPLAADAHEMAGTPAYMAPEMIGSGSPPLSERTDVYLLGAVLYELLCGKPPHEGANLLALLRSIAVSQPSFPDDAPAELARICRRALDADPDARFESAEQLRLAVQGYLQHHGSQELAKEAAQRLLELRVELARPADAVDRDALYNLFGAARFGFQQALRAWRENEAASAGLREATLLLVEHELAADDVRAAAALLAELHPPPPELVARVALAKKRLDEERARAARAAQDFLPEVGRRTRTFLALTLGAVWSIVPFLSGVLDSTPSISRWVYWSLGFLAVLAGVGVWARDTLTKTAFNRRMGSAVLLLFVSQLVLSAGAWLLGFEIVQFQVTMLFVWFLTAASVAVMLEPRVGPAAGGYLLAFLVAAWRPHWVHITMSLSNLVLTVNLVAVWRPRERLLGEQAQRHLDELGARLRSHRPPPRPPRGE